MPIAIESRLADKMSLATNPKKGGLPARSRSLEAEQLRFSIAPEPGVHDDEPLARTIPSLGERIFKLASSLKSARSSFEVATGPKSARSVLDMHFENDVLVGMNHRQPQKCTSHYKSRMKGTMRAASESPLPHGIEEVRRRQEHVENRVVQTPVLISSGVKARTGASGIPLIREAFLSELRDLYTMLSSIEARRYDLCRSDIRALYEWYSVFENFLRVYFFVSESSIYQAGHVDSWEGTSGVLRKAERMREKKKILGLSDKVQAMKRVLLGEGEGGEQKSVKPLRERVDRLAVRLHGFLDEEVRQIHTGLGARYLEEERDAMFRGLVNEMRRHEMGRDMVVLVAKGLGGSVREMERWLVGHCDRAGKLAVQRWIGQFAERHCEYVRLFEKAEYEYRRLYTRLGKKVDKEMEGLRAGRGGRA